MADEQLDPTLPAEPASDEQASEPAPAVPAPEPKVSVKPVQVNLYTRRSDEDALLGSWVDVVAGGYQGRRGHYADDVSHDSETGYPDKVLIRTRDAENELITVNYSDMRPSIYTGGR